MGWDWFNNPNKKEDKPKIQTEVKKEILEDVNIFQKIHGMQFQHIVIYQVNLLEKKQNI